MSDDRQITHSSKPFRRVRKYDASKWKPQKDQVLITQGLYCRACRTRHAYRDQKAVKVQYEKRRELWYSIWVCTATGNVIWDKQVTQ